MNRTQTRVVVAALISLAVTMPAGMAGATTQGAEAADPTIAARHPEPPPLRFGCRLAHVERRPVVGCRWTPIKNRRVAGYVLYRAQVRPEQLPREAVARVRNGDRPIAFDRDLERGTAWVYAVVAVGHRGETLAVSKLDRITIPPAH